MFKRALEKYNIPKELKYLAIVESNLNSRITSSAAGTHGLWKFMPATGRMYDLNKIPYMMIETIR
ncbi:transglycosylase SLT domain-containing protein [Bacteroidetes bacterium endosymbiont of Geopemphigus sp.]|uniref:transglycosylase SLT domain-containing protein n=1 Tax=Bacteroidetes bacterium endosymbiont of Geopemphigus sp. TaxID=2047937 RepID=UPI0018A8591F